MSTEFGYTFFGPDEDPDERGTAWFSIGPVEEDGTVQDEVAVVIFRNHDVNAEQHPEWLTDAEARAQQVALALTLREDVLDRMGEGFDFPESTIEIAKRSEA